MVPLGGHARPQRPLAAIPRATPISAARMPTAQRPARARSAPVRVDLGRGRAPGDRSAAITITRRTCLPTLRWPPEQRTRRSSAPRTRGSASPSPIDGCADLSRPTTVIGRRSPRAAPIGRAKHHDDGRGTETPLSSAACGDCRRRRGSGAPAPLRRRTLQSSAADDQRATSRYGNAATCLAEGLRAPVTMIERDRLGDAEIDAGEGRGGGKRDDEAVDAVVPSTAVDRAAQRADRGVAEHCDDEREAVAPPSCRRGDRHQPAESANAEMFICPTPASPSARSRPPTDAELR